MLWPWLLAFGLLCLAVCWRARDARGQWVAGLWALGIIAMQLPLSEPGRWIYAAALWSFVALLVGLLVGAARAGLVMAAVPLGYFALAAGFEGVPRLLAFGVTEFAGVAAVLTGSWGGLTHVFGDHRRTAALVLHHPLAVAPRESGTAEDVPLGHRHDGRSDRPTHGR